MPDKDKLIISVPNEKQQINESKNRPEEIRHYEYNNIREHDNSSFSNLLSQIDGNKNNNDNDNK